MFTGHIGSFHHLHHFSQNNLVLQDYKTVRDVIVWLDPAMENYTIDAEKEYGVDCWDITWERIWSHFDWFAFGHYFGWGMKVS